MKCFKSNAGLPYADWVYLILIEAKKYLVIDDRYLTCDMYKIGDTVELEDYEVEEFEYDLEWSPLHGTFLFDYFMENYFKKIEQKERLLIAKLLRLAAETFSNHGSNDIPESFWEGWTIEERKTLVKEFYIKNGEMEEAEEGRDYLGNDILMELMADKLEDDIKDFKNI